VNSRRVTAIAITAAVPTAAAAVHEHHHQRTRQGNPGPNSIVAALRIALTAKDDEIAALKAKPRECNSAIAPLRPIRAPYP
jgi:hypothetical protein